MRTAYLAAAVAVVAAVFAGTCSADTLHMKDGRFFNFAKVIEVEGGYKVPLAHGEVFVPSSLVLNAYLLRPVDEFVPRTDEEKEKFEKGMVPFEDKWVTKSKYEKLVKDREEETRKIIEDRRSHLLWRNRYTTMTKHFVFEYTIAPEICENYRDLMETYFNVFAKKFHVVQTNKNGGRLKVCFYHDDEYYYQVSGAPYGAIGYFRFVDPLELNFFYDRTDPELTFDVLFHECNHYLVHLINPNFVYPPWLAEGMAEYYGASTWDPEKKELHTGLLQEGRLIVLKDSIDGNDWMDLEEMLRIPKGGPFGGIHYAWSWALVHMFMENSKLARSFEKFFVHIATGKGVKRREYGFGKETIDFDEQMKWFKAFVKFKDLKELQSRWYQYIKDMEVKTGRGYTAAGNMAARWDRKFRAIRMYQTAIEKGAATALTYYKLADLLEDKKKDDEALEAYKKAVELAPLTGAYTMALGNALWRKGGSENRAEGERLMHLAIEIDPDNSGLKNRAASPNIRKN